MMSDRYSRAFSPCLLIISLLLSSCASLKGEHKAAVPVAQPAPQAQLPPQPVAQAQPAPEVQRVPQAQAQPTKPPVQPPAVRKPQNLPVPEPARPIATTKQLVEKGDYQRALDEYRASHRRRPRDQALTVEYAKSVEDMKSAADKAYEKEEYPTAGRTYDLLLKRHGEFKDFVQTLTFDRTYLNQRLSLCKKSLSARGFQEYRKGNLSEAILLWQGLLTLDPNNEDIKKAMITATEQQRNLQTKR